MRRMSIDIPYMVNLEAELLAIGSESSVDRIRPAAYRVTQPSRIEAQSGYRPYSPRCRTRLWLYRRE